MATTTTKSEVVRVFLSSTCYDLLDLRQELRSFLDANGFSVVLSEDPRSPFIVDPLDDSIASCLHNVENSDVLVCIIDRRYGGVLRLPPHTGLCATQLEVRHARDRALPCFFFVRDVAWLDYQQLRRDSGYATRWVEPDNPNSRQKWMDFVAEVTALPGTNGVSNWRDTFSASTDLKKLVLKRLADHFPDHRGVIAMHPDRLVRLHFVFQGTNTSGLVSGHFRNVGIGPALNIQHGVRIGKRDVLVISRGAVGEKESIVSPGEKEFFYEMPPNQAPVLFCEYDNRFGDRYRVELSLFWTAKGYEPSPPDKFFVVGQEAGS